MIPYDPSTNVPILYTATLLRAYRAFATTFEAMEAPFFQGERVLKFSGRRCTVNKPKLVPEEFVAEENVNYQKDMSASEGANANNRMVKRQTYHCLSRRNHQRLPNKDHSPLTLHLQPKKPRSSSSQPPTNRSSSCNGITASVTLPSQSSSSSPSMAKSQRSLPRCCLSCVQAAYLAQ